MTKIRHIPPLKDKRDKRDELKEKKFQATEKKRQLLIEKGEKNSMEICHWCEEGKLLKL